MSYTYTLLPYPPFLDANRLRTSRAPLGSRDPTFRVRGPRSPLPLLLPQVAKDSACSLLVSHFRTKEYRERGRVLERGCLSPRDPLPVETRHGPHVRPSLVSVETVTGRTSSWKSKGQTSSSPPLGRFKLFRFSPPPSSPGPPRKLRRVRNHRDETGLDER